MAIEHSYKEYQKRKQKEREVLDRSNDNERHGPRPATQFQPRAVKVKKEPEEEMDFKTRMKMMQNSKAAPKKTIFGIKVHFRSVLQTCSEILGPTRTTGVFPEYYSYFRKKISKKNREWKGKRKEEKDIPHRQMIQKKKIED